MKSSSRPCVQKSERLSAVLGSVAPKTPLMRENELAARRKKAFRPRTTIAGERVAPNLIKDLEPSSPDQIWVSDITYVSTLEGWLYLAVILDLFSRKVVGWKLGETLQAELVVAALKNALVLRQPEPGLYFHSDQGSQYR